jgi:hypothetical protein
MTVTWPFKSSSWLSEILKLVIAVTGAIDSRGSVEVIWADGGLERKQTSNVLVQEEREEED